MSSLTWKAKGLAIATLACSGLVFADERNVVQSPACRLADVLVRLKVENKKSGREAARILALRSKYKLQINAATAAEYFTQVDGHPALTPVLKEQLSWYRTALTSLGLDQVLPDITMGPLEAIRIETPSGILYKTVAELAREIPPLPSPSGRASAKRGSDAIAFGTAVGNFIKLLNQQLDWREAQGSPAAALEKHLQEVQALRPELVAFVNARGAGEEIAFARKRIAEYRASVPAKVPSFPQYKPGRFVPPGAGSTGTYHLATQLEAADVDGLIDQLINRGLASPGLRETEGFLAPSVLGSRAGVPRTDQLFTLTKTPSLAQPSSSINTLVTLNTNRVVTGTEGTALGIGPLVNPEEISKVQWRSPERDTVNLQFLYSQDREILEVQVYSEKLKAISRRFYTFDPTVRRYLLKISEMDRTTELLAWPEFEELQHRLYAAKKMKLSVPCSSGDVTVTGPIQSYDRDTIALRVSAADGTSQNEKIAIGSLDQKALLQKLRDVQDGPTEKTEMAELSAALSGHALGQLPLQLKNGKKLLLTDYRILPVTSAEVVIEARVGTEVIAIPVQSIDAKKSLPEVRHLASQARNRHLNDRMADRSYTTEEGATVGMLRRLKKSKEFGTLKLVVQREGKKETIQVAKNDLTIMGHFVEIKKGEILDIGEVDRAATRALFEQELQARRPGAAAGPSEIISPLQGAGLEKLWAFRQGGPTGLAPFLEWFEEFANSSDPPVSEERLRRSLTLLSKYEPGKPIALDVKPVRGSKSLLEMRLLGKGSSLRVYFTVAPGGEIVLLGAGTKAEQTLASSGGDIALAAKALAEFRTLVDDDKLRSSRLLKSLE